MTPPPTLLHHRPGLGLPGRPHGRRAAGVHGSGASAGDNAAMKYWHALLQNNVLNRRPWRTHDELHEAIVFWAEHTYNRRRRQRALGKLTPVEYELALTAQAAAVAA